MICEKCHDTGWAPTGKPGESITRPDCTRRSAIRDAIERRLDIIKNELVALIVDVLHNSGVR